MSYKVTGEMVDAEDLFDLEFRGSLRRESASIVATIENISFF